MQITRVQLIIISLIIAVPVMAFFIDPQPTILRIIIGLVIPFSFIILQVIMYATVEGFRSENEEEYIFFLEHPDERIEIKKVDSLGDRLRNAKTGTQVVVEKQPPTVREISVGIDLLISAISALVVSNFIFFSDLIHTGQLSRIALFSFFSLMLDFVMAIGIINTLRLTKRVNDKDIRYEYISLSNLLGFVALLISFFILGEAIV